MKNSLFCAALAGLFLVSCSKEDDNDDENGNDNGNGNGNNNPIETSDLTKRWYFVSDEVGGVTFPYDDHEACGKDYIEFLSGGIGREVDIWDCEEEVYPFAWDLDEDVLTLSDGGTESAQATIINLSVTILEIETVFDYDDDGDEEIVIQKFTSQN
ncbi:MAG TPA: lipocalin family protein [Flavobacterium sp.]